MVFYDSGESSGHHVTPQRLKLVLDKGYTSRKAFKNLQKSIQIVCRRPLQRREKASERDVTPAAERASMVKESDFYVFFREKEPSGIFKSAKMNYSSTVYAFGDDSETPYIER